MKILKVEVDELPESCSDCVLSDYEYCLAKDPQWIDRTSNTRDMNCPLVKTINNKL